ncbi:Polyketide synthase PksL [Bacillus subtilis]|nr:Polyketide synthase PksL [Bacillus cereus]CUB36519.1 Polyketide synthase PksL [Bacillus subtilis]
MHIKQILSLIEEQQMSPDTGLELIRTYRKEQIKNGTEQQSQVASQTVFFKRDWISSKNDDVQKQQAPRSILIFDRDKRLSEYISMLYKDQVHVILVTPNVYFSCPEQNVYTIDPSNEAHYENLFADLEKSKFTPGCVLYLWNSAVPELSEELIHKALLNGILPLFVLTKALINAKYDNTKLLHMYWTNGQIQPFNEAVGGFIKTVNMESSKLKAKTLQIHREEPNSDPAASQLWEMACNELQSFHSNECEILIDSHSRYIKGMQHVDLENAKPLALKHVSYHKGGVYIITGGAGKLGLIFAEHIANEVEAVIILTGRSALSEVQREQLRKLNAKGSFVEYIQTDISERIKAEQFIRDVKQQHGQISGVIHAAGLIQDSFIAKKNLSEFVEVLKPKVFGTIWMDELTKDENLDFFILFSSVAANGNAGQSDYAYANSFMDSYAMFRNQLNRNGKTLSINWPLWKEGGMNLDDSAVVHLKEKFGMIPIHSTAAFKAFDKMMQSSFSNIMPVEGDRDKLLKTIPFRKLTPSDNQTEIKKNTEDNEIVIKDKVNDYLIKTICSELKIPNHKINAYDSFEKFGINSLIIMSLISKLEDTFGDLPKTIFFEYRNVDELADFFLKSFKETVLKEVGIAQIEAAPKLKKHTKMQQKRQPTQAVSVNTPINEDIAIIGVSGRYPMADNIVEFWDCIIGGKNCITEIPKERWDFRSDYSPDRMDRGKINSKWGGFINRVDQFDPLFFHISHKEAEMMDPQERIFLETAWHTFEDSGYTRDRLDGMRTGVFVGAMYGQYQLFGAEETAKGNAVALSSFFSSIANRVSYFFNFSGPSIALDTMCSSSLTAIHLACESIKRGESEIALAGGVNVSIHPNKYLWLSQGNFVSTEGLCRSFGEGGNGYVPGEGAGAVLLKPLHKAINDQDCIYGVIKGTAVNHGGKTNGFTVPNPNAQAELIAENFKKSGISPRSISYLEAHGTGTSLGDPIEIAGLTKAFEQFTDDKQFCAIGSVKSNIGHLESAAGIAALTKVLLQFKHRKLAPSIHSERLNTNINFENTPFYVQQKEEEWRKEAGITHRRAAVSSFGAGGANAHIILEEYENHIASVKNTGSGPYAAVLSARNEGRLREYARRLLQYTDQETAVSVADIAYTLQTCREPMEERIAFVASDLHELRGNLKLFCDEGIIGDNVYKGNVTKDYDKVFVFHDRKMKEQFLKAVMEKRDVSDLAKLWSYGVDIQWRNLYEDRPKARRVDLPLYPFAEESYWVPRVSDEKLSALQNKTVLHPLLDSNESTLEQQYFKKTVMEKEIWLKDHVVKDKHILPAAVFLEMACAAGNLSYRRKKVSGLKNITFIRPAMLYQESVIVYSFISVEDGRILFKMTADEDAGTKAVFASGELSYDAHQNVKPIESIDRHEIIKRSAFIHEHDECYRHFRENGFDYGRSFQSIQRLWGGDTEALAHLILPQEAAHTFNNNILPPSLLDGALQSLFGITEGRERAFVYVPYSIGEIYIHQKVPEECWVYARKTSQKDQFEFTYDIMLVNHQGDLLVQLQNVTLRKGEVFSDRDPYQKKQVSSVTQEKLTELLGQLQAGELTTEEADHLLAHMLD